MNIFYSAVIVSSIAIMGMCPSAYATMTWDDCVAHAKAHHPDLVAAQEAIKQAEAQEQVAASSLFPQIGASLSDKTSQPIASSNQSQTDSYSYSLSGSQLLFDGSKTSSNRYAARAQVTVAQQQYRNISSDVLLRLRTAFIQVMDAQERITLTETIKKRRAQNKEIVALQYNIGREHKGALMSAEADLARAESDVRKAKRQYVLAYEQLAKELGIVVSSTDTVKEDDLPVIDAQSTPLFSEYRDKHPSVTLRRMQQEAAQYSLAAAKADFFPLVSANASVGGASSQWQNPNHNWSLGINASLPLFDGKQRTSRIHDRAAALQAAQENLESTRRSVLYTLQQQWTSVLDAWDTLSVQKKYLAAATERATIAQAQYSTGLISFDNWTIIENDLVNAKKSLLDARTNAFIAEAKWKQAMGGILDEE